MIIDFSKVTANDVPNLKGGEGHVFNKGENVDIGRIILNTIPAGSSIGMHTHTDNYEICYIISGHGIENTPEGSFDLYPGMSTYCPKGGSHELVNEGPEDFVFFGVLPDAK